MAFKMSKAKEYAILYLRNKKSVDEIAEELQISVNSVQEILDNNPVEEPVPSKSEQSFQRPNQGVAILTKEGSAIAEEIVASPPKRENVIYRPNG